jgi:hypothetical protein
MTTTRRQFVAVAAVLPAVLMARQAAAQGSTPIVIEEQPTGLLGQVYVDQLPVPHAEVWFIRFMLEPGGSLPLDVQIGPTVAVVESGELTLVTDQPVEVDGGMASPGGTGAMLETVVTSGQTVYVHEDTSLAARNDGDAPVSFLTLLTFSGVREVEAMEQQPEGTPAEPVGFTQQPLGVTRAEFPEGPGTITIERLVLNPDGAARTDVPDGAIAGGVERGSVTVSVDSGNGFLWRDMMQPLGPEGGTEEPRREAIGPGDAGDLVANDGFGFWDAGIDWQAGGDGVTMIVARVEPAAAATPMATPSG